MAKDETKDYKIFELLDSIDLKLDSETLSSQIAKVQAAMKMFGVVTPARKTLRRCVNSLISIKSALDRVDPMILQSDLEDIKNNIQKVFDDFKLLTGITYIPKVNKLKKEAKKKIYTDLADLEILTNKEYAAEKENEELELKRSEYNLLEKYLEDMRHNLEDNPDKLALKMSLIIDGTSPDYKKFPRLGIITTRTSYGILWSNQYVLAIKKEKKLSNKELETIMENHFDQKMTLLYSMPMLYKDFPEYYFFWFWPTSFLSEVTLQIEGYALPFPNRSTYKDLKFVMKNIQNLKKLRMEAQLEKKGKRNGPEQA